MNIPSELQTKLKALQDIFRGYGRAAIAFSGGVDSTLLLKVAHDTIGENSLPFFADSVLQTAEERQGAIAIAHAIGTSLNVVSFNPFADPEFIANGKLRCYHCKKSIFSIFIKLASQRNCPWLADGTNLDDLTKDRPGALAIAELGVKSPLAEVGLTKHGIRELSRRLDLPTWNKPSASCLATRIPTDTPITFTDLTLIEQAERILHDFGYHGCRVRLAATSCYLELVAGDIDRLMKSGKLVTIRDALFALGPTKVLLDLSERESILS